MSEHDEQKFVVKWWKVYSRIHGFDERLLFAIPNAAKRGVKLAAMMKAEGMRPGVPDLFLATDNGTWHGLFIEMKRTGGGVVSDVQTAYQKVLNGAGYCSVVCHGYGAAIDCIKAYLGVKRNETAHGSETSGD